MAKSAERVNLLADLPDETIEMFRQIANETWADSLQAHAVIRNGPGKGVQTKFKNLGNRDKQKMVVDFFANVMGTHTYRMRLIAAAHEDPLAFAKIFMTTVPKEIEANVTVNQGVVILPAKAGTVGAWMEMVNGGQTIDAEVIGAAGQSAAETWQKVLADKRDPE